MTAQQPPPAPLLGPEFSHTPARGFAWRCPGGPGCNGTESSGYAAGWFARAAYDHHVRHDHHEPDEQPARPYGTALATISARAAAATLRAHLATGHTPRRKARLAAAARPAPDTARATPDNSATSTDTAGTPGQDDANARTHTPDRVDTTDDGRTITTFKLKRACNGCGQHLGDADNRDIDNNGNLTDVRGECDRCRPLVELERAGCRTRQLTPHSLRRIDDEIDRDGIYAKGYWETVNGKNTVTGLRIGSGEDRIVARFGDWIIRHPDGRWTVHQQTAPAPDAPRRLGGPASRVYALPDGDFAIVGTPAPDLAAELPPDAGIGDDETLVTLPRAALTSARPDIPEEAP